MVNVIILTSFILINFYLAKKDAEKIKQGKKILHGINGLVYAVLTGVVYLLTHSWLVCLGVLILRVPIFNTALNYYRGLDLEYISSSTTSIIDRITNFIPRKIGYWTYQLILFAAAMVLILLTN